MAGLILLVKPIASLGVETRPEAVLVLAAGLCIALIAFLLPVSDSTTSRAESKLDQLIPTWQFNERHSLRVAASPERVFESIQQVRAGEVAWLHTLTWVRRAGRNSPESILNAGNEKPLLEVALKSGFSLLANDPPREVVIGLSPIEGSFAAMNFTVHPDGANGSIVSTETRIVTYTALARRRFAAYWRLIYPGSALLRRTWLRAIRRRAATY